MIVWCCKCDKEAFTYRLRAIIDNKDVAVTVKCHDALETFTVSGEAPRPIVRLYAFQNGQDPLTRLMPPVIMGDDDGVEQ